MNIYVEFSNKDQVKKLGCKWVRDERHDYGNCWKCPFNNSKENVKKLIELQKRKIISFEKRQVSQNYEKKDGEDVMRLGYKQGHSQILGFTEKEIYQILEDSKYVNVEQTESIAIFEEKIMTPEIVYTKQNVQMKKKNEDIFDDDDTPEAYCPGELPRERGRPSQEKGGKAYPCDDTEKEEAPDNIIEEEKIINKNIELLKEEKQKKYNELIKKHEEEKLAFKLYYEGEEQHLKNCIYRDYCQDIRSWSN